MRREEKVHPAGRRSNVIGGLYGLLTGATSRTQPAVASWPAALYTGGGGNDCRLRPSHSVFLAAGDAINAIVVSKQKVEGRRRRGGGQGAADGQLEEGAEGRQRRKATGELNKARNGSVPDQFIRFVIENDPEILEKSLYSRKIEGN